MSEYTKYYISKHSKGIDYIDLDDGEIAHFKYISKKRVNGKWRYYYDTESMKKDFDKVKDKLGAGEKKRFEELEKKFNEAAKRQTEAYDRMDRATTRARQQRKTGIGDAETVQNKAESAAKEYKKRSEEIIPHRKNVNDAERAYDKTVVGKVRNAKQEVKWRIEDAANAIQKGKKKLASRLKRKKNK